MPTNHAQDAADAARVRVRTFIDIESCAVLGCTRPASPTGGGLCDRHDQDRADREMEAIEHAGESPERYDHGEDWNQWG